MKYITLLIFIINLSTRSNSQTVIKIEDLSKHIGDSVKIYTKIYGGRYLYRVKEKPTYLDVGADYPNNPLSIFIANKNRENFEDRPEMMYAYKEVCIIGKLGLEKGKPQIVVTKAEQIVLKE